MDKNQIFRFSRIPALIAGFALALLLAAPLTQTVATPAFGQTRPVVVVDKAASTPTPVARLLLLHRGW